MVLVTGYKLPRQPPSESSFLHIQPLHLYFNYVDFASFVLGPVEMLKYPPHGQRMLMLTVSLLHPHSQELGLDPGLWLPNLHPVHGVGDLEGQPSREQQKDGVRSQLEGC